MVELGKQFPRFAQALELHAKGDFEAARTLYLTVMERPRLTAACLHQLALLAAQRGEPELAVELLRHSLKLDPSHLDTYGNLARILRRLGHEPAALAVMLDQGCTLQNAKLYAQAELPYRAILSHDPLNYGAYVNLGTCLAQMHRLDEAAQQIFRALDLYGRLDHKVADFANDLRQRVAPHIDAPLKARLPAGLPHGRIEKIEDALTTLGKIMTEFCLPEHAILCHRQSIAQAPAFALAHWNLALALLAVGNYSEGWAEYEWRWHWDGFPEQRRYRHLPPWRGEPLQGKRILVWAEQGFGDTLQFTPLVQRLAAMGAQVAFEVAPPLLRLMAHSLQGVIVTQTPVHTPEQGSAPYDYAVAQISLPTLLGPQAQTLPLASHYLQAEPRAQERWDRRMASDGRMRVGIVWAGRTTPDARRSIAYAQLAPLFERKHIRWFSLQVGPQSQDIPVADSGTLEDLSPLLTDFAETAAAMAHLDLVITIDTAAVHLAAGLARPTWLLLPRVADWRWAARSQGPQGENLSVWYPNVCIFQQGDDGQWGSVVEAVGAQLDQRAKP